MDRTIPLYARDGSVRAHTVVSESDYEAIVAVGGWCLQGGGYVWRNSRHDRPKHVYLHRWLAGCVPGDGLYVDHINRNRLDNRRENLRIVTPAQSRQNTPAIGGTSRFRGVHWDKARQKWRASIQLDGRHRQVGRFDSEEDAADAVSAFRMASMPFATE